MTQKRKKTPVKKYSKRPSKKAKKTTKKSISIWSKLFKLGFVTFIWGILALIALVFINAYNLPDIKQAMKFEKRPSVTIIAADHSVLARYGETQGKYLYADEIPTHLKEAILAIEDRRFYSHFGIDPIALTRAFYTNIKEGYFAQGGSTLTQQLAKILFLTPEKTISRKINEALTAFWLEYSYTKDEILSAYINRVYLGAGTYGFDAAAQRYFGKSATLINTSEAAMLAGLLKAPSRYAPHSNPEGAKKRMKTVLYAMKDAGFLKQDPNTLAPPHITAEKSSPSNFYFTNYVFQQIESYVGNSNKDLIVYTTIQPDLQKSASQFIKRYVNEYGPKRSFSQAASLVTTPTGAIVAMIGGIDFKKSQFNRALDARRQIGSAFKPIVYLTAIEDLSVTLDTSVTDEQKDYNGYMPKNYGDKYLGDIALETAFAKSSNTVAVSLLNQTGISAVRKTARKLGITSKLNNDLSLALGSASITMPEMVAAFASISNGGHPVSPYGIKKIQYLDGEILFEHHSYESSALFRTHDLDTLKTMMRSVVTEGTGKNAYSPHHIFYGKTGTSEDYRDAWFIGFSDHYVGAVWLGNDDNTPMDHVTGGSYPALIWKNIMIEAHKNNTATMPSPSKNDTDFVDKILSIFK